MFLLTTHLIWWNYLLGAKLPLFWGWSVVHGKGTSII
jgi:hypothetical protein